MNTESASENALEISKAIADKGFAVVKEFASGKSLVSMRDAVAHSFPQPVPLAAQELSMARPSHAKPFPFENLDLNLACIDPRVIDIARILLDGNPARLTSAFIQAKFGRLQAHTRDQQLHNDAWSSNSLLYPSLDGAFQRIFGILYLSDVTDPNHAPTFVVGKAGSLGAPLLSSTGMALYSRENYPNLYELEFPVLASAGDLLLFTGDLVHRGSEFKGLIGSRYALFFNYHSVASTWTSTHLWAARPADSIWSAVQEMVTRATPEQRELLGFPAPGDSYWSSTGVHMLAQLYPNLNLAPYETN